MRISDWSSDVCSSDLLRWTAGRLDIARRTREIERRSISREAAIDEYIGIFRAAMERIRPDDQNYIHPLSGGRDSRHIFLELVRMGRPPRLALTPSSYPTQFADLDDKIGRASWRERVGQ